MKFNLPFYSASSLRLGVNYSCEFELVRNILLGSGVMKGGLCCSLDEEDAEDEYRVDSIF